MMIESSAVVSFLCIYTKIASQHIEFFNVFLSYTRSLIIGSNSMRHQLVNEWQKQKQKQNKKRNGDEELLYECIF